ncbi:VanW family protein [Deinococcus marmoris]|uniref:Vancomycin B-type resistance protein VanW n=1 Tax=Deinococcus marmoris TaxID=249408 RepID=A0A1U7NZD2_9DEIO|nr:VanW family protein [Deinococcus marmoris]OLV18277.1 Vancomycin B-type resistance protein VanW [Deinococcus marmoris]
MTSFKVLLISASLTVLGSLLTGCGPAEAEAVTKAPPVLAAAVSPMPPAPATGNTSTVTTEPNTVRLQKTEQPLELRWTVPEPRLVGGQVERPLLNMSATVDLSAEQFAQIRAAGNLNAARTALDKAYTGIDDRQPRDIRFRQVGKDWIGEARTGWKVDRAASEKTLLKAVLGGETRSTLTVALEAPARSVGWAAAKKIGHLASGQSSFAGSPDFRVHNIRTGAERVQGAWVAPGRTFSFNALIGPINSATGFQPGYVVTGNTLSTEDGGGICQVSTTVFRAAFNAGLPITERHEHSYLVGYYEEPGLDAAVYAPSKDLRWKNDTAAPLLVQTEWDLKAETLMVSLFGADDGRKVSISEPAISARKPAPDPTFMVDRALEKGAARRVDMPAAGMKAVITRTVTSTDGKQKKEDFVSRYKAWGGVFAVAPGDDRLR